jgi:hypothetical protein
MPCFSGRVCKARLPTPSSDVITGRLSRYLADADAAAVVTCPSVEHRHPGVLSSDAEAAGFDAEQDTPGHTQGGQQ